MKYIFRGHTIFEYMPDKGVVKQHDISGLPIAGFNYCGFINEDYKLLAEFFNTVYRHTQDQDVELKDIIVN